ncbi:hypothetical protein D0Z07_0117 [Hyphodiscus hymeniophilus]|uniref:Uncharacterized protein n=1 Tax=Hyphodiscus hymeniophilus TaxID=353542 RepID=A0A9P6VRP8_9HELO|nr:hypothetical protein D0Z07_0117 [Hyphodiscus hymeniophilus]
MCRWFGVIQSSFMRRSGSLPCDLKVFAFIGQTECIRLLRDRVEKSDLTDGVSDSTISAVATLAAIEVPNSILALLAVY